MPTTLAQIIRDSETHHRLSLFDLAAVKELEAGLFEKNGKPYLKCLATDKDRPAKPEEIVRQLWIKKLLTQYGYPKSRIAVEHPVKFGSETKRADIVVFDKDRPTVEYIMVELKKTRLKDGKDQLKSYCNATGAPIGVWSNGEQYSFYNRKDPNYFNDLTEIPSATQSLTDILNDRWALWYLVEYLGHRYEKQWLARRAVGTELDYAIFFATQRRPGKDTSGDKIFVKRPAPPEVIKNGKKQPKAEQQHLEIKEVPDTYEAGPPADEYLPDLHGHLIVDHDLFNHDGLTQDGIAEAFQEFAKKEKLSFF